MSTIAGLDRLEVRSLSISTRFGEDAATRERGKPDQLQDGPASVAILTIKGELLSAGEAFSVDPGTGTFLAPRIGPHAVTGEVDFLGNGVRNAVLESPEIRQVEVQT